MWDDRTYTRRYNGGWQSWKTLAWTSDIPTKSSWNYDDVYSKLGHTHDDRYYTESEINTKLSSYLPLAGGTMTGNITYTGKGTSYIGNGASDGASGVGGTLNNLVISSWYGVSFTTSCGGQTYTNKNAVSINCRNGYVYANTFVGALSGNASSATTTTYLNVQYCRDDGSPSNKGLWNTIKNGTTNAITDRVRFYTIYGTTTALGAPIDGFGELLEICSYNTNHWQP